MTGAVPSQAELAALLAFYADAGVDTLCEDTPQDRFAEKPDAAGVSRQRAAPAQQADGGASGAASHTGYQAQGNRQRAPSVASSPAPSRTAAPAASQAIQIPDEAAFADARAVAASAGTLDDLKAALSGFEGCNLRFSARNTVFADGNPAAPVMLIGEAPGREEDQQGLPFVGRAGQLLDRMLAAIGLDRTQVYITNIIPWRPPGNRTPTPHEVELCRPFIERHVRLVRPRVIVLLGNVATKALVGTDKGILSTRGTWFEIAVEDQPVPALATLHPAYLLRNPAAKKLAWADLLALSDRIASFQG